MIEERPVSFGTAGWIIGVPGKKLYRWYKEVLSGFADKQVQAELHEYDIADPDVIDRKTGRPKTVAVPIFAPENFGPDMALDDKGIGGEGYSVLSNRTTGKIALLIQTVKAGILIKILNRLPAGILFKVRTLSKDLAPGFDWVARTVFMNAVRIGDKFHVLRLAFEALQDVRVYYRQEILSAERRDRERLKQKERERKEICRKTGEKYIPRKIISAPSKTFENGETSKELLARGRYLLFRRRYDWSDTQKERAAILFGEFPDIETAYDLICGFRDFYEGGLGEVEKARQALESWREKVYEKDIEEICNFASMTEKHEGEILNYFYHGHTNAYAESLNSKIENFINMNSGTRDRDFFHFRLKKYFA